MITQEGLTRLENKIDELNKRLDAVIVLETDMRWVKAGLKTVATVLVGVVGWLGQRVFGS